jgi:gluconolactonase
MGVQRVKQLLKRWSGTGLIALAFAASLPAHAQAGAPAPPGDAIVTTAIPGVVAAGTPLTLIRAGMTSSEGPVAAPDGSVYFSEPSISRVYRVDADDRFTVLFDPQRADDPAGERWRLPALAVNRKGTVFACRRAGAHIGIAIIYPADQAKFIAESYHGMPFIAPNDLSLAKDGGIYFTDPGEGPQRAHAIYYVKPSGEVILATDNLGGPNGLVLSRDEKTLFAVDSQSEYFYAYDVQPDHTLQNRRNFARLQGIVQTDKGMNNGIDGMIIDNEGRLYVISNAGIEVFDPQGHALGIIALPIKAQNLAFAGKDGRTLYIVGHSKTARDGNLYKVRMLAQRYTGRAK